MIEDNLDAAESLRLALELEGHEVAVAHDGPQGIKRARAHARSRALRHRAPGPGRLRRREGAPPRPGLADTFLVALTGYGLPEDQRRAADARFDAHLTKPATVEGLQEAMGGAPPRGPRRATLASA